MPLALCCVVKGDDIGRHNGKARVFMTMAKKVSD